MMPQRHTHYVCGFALSDKLEDIGPAKQGNLSRRFCFEIPRKDAKWIVLLYTLWIWGCFAFETVAVTYSFVDCPFFAKLFFLTNWGLLLVYNFFKVLCVFDTSVRTQEYHCCIGTVPESKYTKNIPSNRIALLNSSKKRDLTEYHKELTPFNRWLYMYLLGSHFVAFMYTLCIFVLYPMIYFFGGTFDLSFISISAMANRTDVPSIILCVSLSNVYGNSS
jgi:hypothetical protein